MTGKGKAFDKPVINKVHKQAVIAHARLRACDDAPRSDLEAELFALIDASDIATLRAADAKAAVREAATKLARNEDPLGGLWSWGIEVASIHISSNFLPASDLRNVLIDEGVPISVGATTARTDTSSTSPCLQTQTSLPDRHSLSFAVGAGRLWQTRIILSR